MDNFLVPFNFQSFQTTEAVWDFSKNEYLKMFRMTRKGWGEFFGAKNPQEYIDILKHRYPHLPDGIPFTVKGMTGQEYTAGTLDILEGHQYAVESDLPRAKDFLRAFPDFLMNFMERKIKPPAIGDIRPEVLGYIGLPHKEKKAYREKAITELGLSHQRWFRECEKAEKSLGVHVVHQRKTRADAGKTKYPELKAAALFIKAQMPNYGPDRIATLLKHPAAYRENIKRWLKAA